MYDRENLTLKEGSEMEFISFRWWRWWLQPQHTASFSCPASLHLPWPAFHSLFQPVTSLLRLSAGMPGDSKGAVLSRGLNTVGGRAGVHALFMNSYGRNSAHANMCWCFFQLTESHIQFWIHFVKKAACFWPWNEESPNQCLRGSSYPRVVRAAQM